MLRADSLDAPPLPPGLTSHRASYAYRCTDQSKLTNFISTRIAPHVELSLPAAWSANAVTWFGSSLMWILLAGLIVCPPQPRGQFAPLWVALLWSYCILDHVDGCRARRRRSSCAYGEFLDHALDAWNAPIAVLAFGLVSGGSLNHLALGPVTMAVAIGSVSIASVAAWLEQKVSGELRLGYVGPVEAVLGTGLYMALWSWPAAAAVLRSPAYGMSSLTWGSVCLWIGAAGSLTGAAVAVGRSPRVLGPLATTLLATTVILALGFTGRIDWVVLYCAVGILSAEYSARVIASHLLGTSLPWPDPLAAFVLILAAAIPSFSSALVTLAMCWMVVRAVLTWRNSTILLRAESKYLAGRKLLVFFE